MRTKRTKAAPGVQETHNLRATGMNSLPPLRDQSWPQITSIVRWGTLGAAAVWLTLVAGLGWWSSQRMISAELDRVASSAEYEAKTTARVVDRLFTELTSVANMVASQNQVVQLAARYRTDPPGFAELTRQERAAIFIRDPLVRKVGDFMRNLSNDLRYARIYMNNLSYNTVTASNWSESFSIVGQIYTGRGYLTDAVREGKGQLFGIARLNQSPSYFVSSRVEDSGDAPLGSVTVKFDAPDMAHYLTGRHVALIVNRQGRVTTASSPSFMLRNVAAMLPPDTLLPSDGDEELGDLVDVRPMAGAGRADQWFVDGRPYLLRREPLTNTSYQLLTLAAIDQIQPMQQRHFWATGLIAAFGLAVVFLSGGAAIHLVDRRQRAEQDRILAISQAAERDLTIKVRERTAELTESNASLKAEMDQRRLLEAKLRQSVDSVNDALAQQREFVAVVSHEFRGPLGVIAVTADNLLLSLRDSPDAVKLRIAKIGRTVNRMSMLIENVLAGDRLNMGLKPFMGDEAFDFNEVIQTVHAGLDEASAARINFVPGDRAIVKGDRVLLELAVQNLVLNALKYSGASKPVIVNLAGAGNVMSVNVIDSGAGVAPKDQELIFTKYYRAAEQSVSGSGLGLYIAREIARQHGGDLILTNSGAAGSTFSLNLPIACPCVAAG